METSLKIRRKVSTTSSDSSDSDLERDEENGVSTSYTRKDQYSRLSSDEMNASGQDKYMANYSITPFQQVIEEKEEESSPVPAQKERKNSLMIDLDILSNCLKSGVNLTSSVADKQSKILTSTCLKGALCLGCPQCKGKNCSSLPLSSSPSQSANM